jgi:hypothetical protein
MSVVRITYTSPPPRAAGLPPGVTLQQIDGGPAYYADNGFTNATSTAFSPTGFSWDDPRFFPIINDFCFYPANSTSSFFELGLNVNTNVTDFDMSYLRDAGIWNTQAYPPVGTDTGAETVGWDLDEPNDWSVVTDFATSVGDNWAGRFFWVNWTWNQFGVTGNFGDVAMSTIMSTLISTSAGNVHINMPSGDIYWFSGSTITGGTGVEHEAPIIYGVSSMTTDQIARGCHYGDMTTQMRGWMTTYPAPVFGGIIELQAGLQDDTGVRLIIPAEMNQAAWSNIIHGARGIQYFGTTGPYESTFGFNPDPEAAQGGMPAQTISAQTQGVNTNTLITQLAPVINSPFALGYFTVSPPPVILSATTLDSGIDAMAKYVTNGGPSGLGTGLSGFGNGFYIIASTRDSENATDISATFTTADGYSGTVTAINADGGGTSYGTTYTLTASGGVFSDTLATGLSVRIYYIP